MEPTCHVVEKYGVDLTEYFGSKEAFPGKETPTLPSNAGKRPSQLAISIYLPTIRSIKKAHLEINEKELRFSFPKKFELVRSLPYAVDQDKGTAKFDREREVLVITVPLRPLPS